MLGQAEVAENPGDIVVVKQVRECVVWAQLGVLGHARQQLLESPGGMLGPATVARESEGQAGLNGKGGEMSQALVYILLEICPTPQSVDN